MVPGPLFDPALKIEKSRAGNEASNNVATVEASKAVSGQVLVRISQLQAQYWHGYRISVT